jgi:malate permease and related proteins
LTALLTLFLNNLFPILLVARIGYLAGKLLHIEPKALSKVVFYVFSPSLIFNLLITSQLNNDDIFRMMGFAATQFFLMGFIAWVAGRIFKLERKLFVAVILVAISVNAGNYGMSLNLFAFGEEALAYAGLYFTTAAILTYTVGVTIASMGSKNLGQSLAQLIKIPTVYAVVLAIIFNLTGWVLPTPFERSVSILAGAAIPGMIVLLGLQLQHNQRSWNLGALGLATGLRLLGGATLAITTAGIFGLQGMAYNAGIIEASMPTAVLSTVLATEFDVEPAFVTSAVFITTILSPLTLTPLLAYLGA